MELGLDEPEQGKAADRPQRDEKAHATFARVGAGGGEPAGERDRQQRGPQPHAVADLRGVILERAEGLVGVGGGAIEDVREQVLVDERRAVLEVHREVPRERDDHEQDQPALELERAVVKRAPLVEQQDVEQADAGDDGEPGRALREHADAEDRVAPQHVDLAHRRDRLHLQDVVGDRIGLGPTLTVRPRDRERQAAHDIAIDRVALPRHEVAVDDPPPTRRARIDLG